MGETKGAATVSRIDGKPWASSCRVSPHTWLLQYFPNCPVSVFFAVQLCSELSLVRWSAACRVGAQTQLQWALRKCWMCACIFDAGEALDGAVRAGGSQRSSSPSSSSLAPLILYSQILTPAMDGCVGSAGTYSRDDPTMWGNTLIFLNFLVWCQSK